LIPYRACVRAYSHCVRCLWQIATIALASAKDPVGVTLGGIIGHALCTGIAVVGGRMLAARISEKTVATVGRRRGHNRHMCRHGGHTGHGKTVDSNKHATATRMFSRTSL